MPTAVRRLDTGPTTPGAVDSAVAAPSADRPAADPVLVPPRSRGSDDAAARDRRWPGPAGRPTGRPRWSSTGRAALRIDTWGPGADHARASGAGDDRHGTPAGRRCRTTTVCSPTPPAASRRAHRRQRGPLPRPPADDPGPADHRRRGRAAVGPAVPRARRAGARARPRAAAAAPPRTPGRAPGVVVPPAGHRGQAGPGPHRGRPHRRPAVALGRASPTTSWPRRCPWSGASDRGRWAR